MTSAGAGVAPRRLQQQQREEDADDHVEPLGVVHHGHARGQPLVVPDVVGGADHGQQRQRAVQPGARASAPRLLGLLGRLGRRLGEEAQRDGEGHVHGQLDQQVEHARVRGVELEERPERSRARRAASAGQAWCTISPPTSVSRAVWPTRSSSGAVSGSCSSTARSAAQPGASRPRSRSAKVTARRRRASARPAPGRASGARARPSRGRCACLSGPPRRRRPPRDRPACCRWRSRTGMRWRARLRCGSS